MEIRPIESNEETCLPEMTIFAFSKGELDDREAERCAKHFDICPVCHQQLERFDNQENDPLYLLITELCKNSVPDELNAEPPKFSMFSF